MESNECWSREHGACENGETRLRETVCENGVYIHARSLQGECYARVVCVREGYIGGQTVLKKKLF